MHVCMHDCMYVCIWQRIFLRARRASRWAPAGAGARKHDRHTREVRPTALGIAKIPEGTPTQLFCNRPLPTPCDAQWPTAPAVLDIKHCPHTTRMSYGDFHTSAHAIGPSHGNGATPAAVTRDWPVLWRRPHIATQYWPVARRSSRVVAHDWPFVRGRSSHIVTHAPYSPAS